MNDLKGKLFFSTISLGAAALGGWQLHRYQWKVGIIDDMKATFQGSRLVDLPVSTSQKFLSDYISHHNTTSKEKKVMLSGEFDHDKEVLLGPRSAPPNLVGASAQGLAVNPQGYYVFTPLKRSDGTLVFVNRGWVSMKEKNWHRPIGPITVQAIIVGGESEGLFSPKNDASSKQLLWLEPSSLLRASGLTESEAAPVIIAEAFENDDIPISTSPIAKRPRHFFEHHVSPMTHLVYAFTWYVS